MEENQKDHLVTRQVTIKRLIGYFIIGGIACTLLFIPYYLNYSWKGLSRVFIVNGLLFFLLSVGNGLLAEVIQISWTEKPIKRLMVTIVTTILVTIIIAIGVQVLIYGICCSLTPMQVINSLGREYYYHVLMITFIVATFLHGRGFFIQWRESIKNIEELKRANLAAQYEGLKNQINPHFLFNNLNVLTALVHKSPDLSERFIQQLSKVYRYVLEMSQEELVPLYRELEAMEAYVFLLKIRFGENLHIDNRIQQSEDFFIPPLSLQMLLENAIKHNIISKDQPLHIVLSQTKGLNKIIISNNLQRKYQVQDSLGVGLKNINQRYHHFSHKEVKVYEEKDQFIVELPLIQAA
ncbi:MAG: histidine kinase [Bacteroidota bacterium]